MKIARRRRVTPVITIISLVDILTIVLIFFIMTTTFKTQQPQVVIDLPEVKVSKKVTADSAPAILAIDKNGDVSLEDKPISLDDVGASVKKIQDDKRPLGLKVDEHSPAGKMFEVLDALKTAGVETMPAFTREKP